MSGRTHDDTNRPGHPAALGLDADFETDLRCALTNTSPVLITAPADVATAVATRIHRNGVNRTGAFLTIDCGKAHLPEQLDMVFDSAAPRGTVFLRDVDRLGPALQSLLYFRIVPLGVRVIAATSASLLCALTQGTFDERLFYRLNQIHLVAAQPSDPCAVA
ncbi:MAG: sigma 54-interacting transcriptional regulator [Vicinamibacterales bacterium]